MCGQELFWASSGSLVESVGNGEVVCCLASAFSPVPRCLGLRSDQLVLKGERLIGDESPGDVLNPAVGQKALKIERVWNRLTHF